MNAIDNISNYVALHEEYVKHAYDFYGKAGNKEIDFYNAIVWGGIKTNEAVALAEILQYLKPKRILEIGSFIGLSTRWILSITEPWGAEVTSIDPNIEQEHVGFPRDHLKHFCAGQMDRLTLVDAFASSRLLPNKPKYLSIPLVDEPMGEFDFAFVDGLHHFFPVLQNTALAASMLPQSGGIVVGHDSLTWEEVIPATEVYARTSPLLDYCVINRVKTPLGSPLLFKKWNENRMIRKKIKSSTLGKDGLTMLHVPKGYSAAPRVNVEEDYNQPRKVVKERFLAERPALLKKRLLKRPIAEQLRRWGYSPA